MSISDVRRPARSHAPLTPAPLFVVMPFDGDDFQRFQGEIREQRYRAGPAGLLGCHAQRLSLNTLPLCYSADQSCCTP